MMRKTYPCLFNIDTGMRAPDDPNVFLCPVRVSVAGSGARHMEYTLRACFICPHRIKSIK